MLGSGRPTNECRSLSVTDPKSIAAARAGPAPNAIPICLALGTFALVTGCFAGVERAGNRELILFALGGAILLFAAASVLQMKRPGVAAAESPQSARTAPPPAAAPVAHAPAPQTPAGAPVDVSRTEWPVAVLAPPQVKAAAPIAPAAHAEDLPDVPALMRVPLSDLLLAALCKDPQGARRIFAEVALQDDQNRLPTIPR